MKKYQNFVEELSKIKEEESRVKELYMKEFFSDVENELLKNGAIPEEIDKEDLHIRDKDTKGTYSTMPNKIKVYWIYNKECGFYLESIPMFTIIQIYEIGINKKSERTFSCEISNLNPDVNHLDGKAYNNVPKFIKKVYKYIKERAIKNEFKRDIKKYNL